MDGTDKERVLHDEIRRDMVISKIELRRKHLRHMHINKEMLQDCASLALSGKSTGLDTSFESLHRNSCIVRNKLEGLEVMEFPEPQGHLH